MINKLDKEVNFHQQALGLRVKRQEILSGNVANADTPNFKARDIDFSTVLSEKLSSESAASKLVTTSPKHISLRSNDVVQDALYRIPYQASADGNTVEMDSERARFADNAIRYDASVTFISGQFRSLLSAIQE